MELEQIKFSFDEDNVVISTKPITDRKKSQKSKNYDIAQKYQELYGIYAQLYDMLNIDLFDLREFIYVDDLVAYPDERQAEVNGTQFLDLDEKIRRNYDYLENRKKELI